MSSTFPKLSPPNFCCEFYGGFNTLYDFVVFSRMEFTVNFSFEIFTSTIKHHARNWQISSVWTISIRRNSTAKKNKSTYYDICNALSYLDFFKLTFRLHTCIFYYCVRCKKHIIFYFNYIKLTKIHLSLQRPYMFLKPTSSSKHAISNHFIWKLHCSKLKCHN